jgi:hypothetical protein
MRGHSGYILLVDQDLNPGSPGSPWIFSFDMKPILYGASLEARGQVRMQGPLQCHYLRRIKLQTQNKWTLSRRKYWTCFNTAFKSPLSVFSFLITSNRELIVTLNRVERVYWCVRCWRRVEIDWTDLVKSEDVLRAVKEERNIQQAIKRRKANWIDHILRRNCLLNHVIEKNKQG